MSDVHPETVKGYLILLGLYNTYMVSTIAAFWYFRKLEFLQKRQPFVALFHAIVTWLTGNELLDFTPYREINWIEKTTGDIGTYLILYICTPLWMLCYFLRCISLVSQFYGNAIHVTETKLNFVERSIFKLLKLFSRGKRVSFETSSTSSMAKMTEDTNVVTFNLTSFVKTVSAVAAIEVILVLIALGYTGCYNAAGKCVNTPVQKSGLDVAPVYAFVACYVLLLPYFLYLIRKVRSLEFSL
ncbi:hypothetical protein BKA69DRAFT_645129 [Paraphysoderma sedebokerense]|nr:hypothetical protein BKA69DRAFT_645129 [Paraphysoderma sedebokerense]